MTDLLYTGYPYVEPGTKVFMVLSSINGDFVIEAKVEETEDIYDGVEKTDWHHKDIFGADRISIATEEKDENGCTKYRDLTLAEFLKEFPEAKRVNQFLWVDEPVGHAVQLGDEVFLTLNEALLHVRPSAKKHLLRKLKGYRERVMKFISHTWEMSGHNAPKWPKYPDKKVYVRKK